MSSATFRFLASVRIDRYFAYGLAVMTAGCFPAYERGDVLRETTYSAPPYTVVEEVQYEYDEYFDEYYQRVYVVKSEEKELAEFRGETTMWSVDSDLALSSPKVVEDWLAVFSRSQVWIWQPGQKDISFDPIGRLNANDWEERQLVAPSMSDYWVSDFNISNGKWILEYTDVFVSEDESDLPVDRFYLVSEDEGKTFLPVAADSDIIVNSL